MAYATVEDVQARYHEEIDEALAVVVGTRLGDAELIIRNSIPDLDDRVAESETYEQIVIMVESDMVLRLIKNPDGYSQESDGNYSYAIYQQVASGRLEVLDDEWDLLAPNGGKGAYVIRPWVYDDPASQEGAYDPWKGLPPWYEDFNTGLPDTPWNYHGGGGAW
jgi:hypothetical protein